MTGEFSVAVHALVVLNHRSQEILSSEALAQNVCTNPARIRKVMAKLRKAGLIETKSGSEGGYCFKGDPGAVNLKMVCDAIDGRVVPRPWASGDAGMDCLIASGMAGVLEEICDAVDAAGRQTLAQTTIADIEGRIFKDSSQNNCGACR
ncbi:MAG: Rrf2 family transcriptional regulator [Eubacterium sp.]|nr:Rrf2 family transcriptional regulator [Eubacterium sp.]